MSLSIVLMFLAAAATPGWQGVRPEKLFDIGKVRVLQSAPAGYRHAVLAGVDLPTSGLDVTLTCSYRMGGEGWGRCRPSDGFEPGEDVSGARSAAARQMGWTRIDMSKLSAFRPVDFVSEAKVHLSPADRLDLQPPPRGDAAYVTNVVWDYKPPADAVAREYPDRALRLGMTGSATVACRVLEDLSPACVTVSVSDPEYGFETSAPRIMGLSRVAPKLTDGRPAVGVWIRTRVLFSLPE